MFAVQSIQLLTIAIPLIGIVLADSVRLMHAGQPMAWAGHSWAAYAQYMPFALAGLLLPFLVGTETGRQPRWALAGFSAAWGALAEILTQAGMGSGYVLALWAAAAQLACLLLPAVRRFASAPLHSPRAIASPGNAFCSMLCCVHDTVSLISAHNRRLTNGCPWLRQGKGGSGTHLLSGLIAASPALVASAPHALMLSLHIVQKGANSGAVLGAYGSDMQVVVVIALATLGLVGFLGPLAAQLHARRIRVCMLCRCMPYCSVSWLPARPHKLRHVLIVCITCTCPLGSMHQRGGSMD